MKRKVQQLPQETLAAIDDRMRRLQELSRQLRQAGADDVEHMAAQRRELAALRKLVTDEERHGA